MGWGGGCFDPAVHTDPVEVYSSSQLAVVPAKILSPLGRLTHGSCFVTCAAVKVDGEEVFFESCFPSLCVSSPPVSCVSSTSTRGSKLLTVLLPPHSPSPSFICHRASTILHLLLKAVIHPTPRSQKPEPGPGTPAPTAGAELCMVGSSETGGFATALAVTYITPQ